MATKLYLMSVNCPEEKLWIGFKFQLNRIENKVKIRFREILIQSNGDSFGTKRNLIDHDPIEIEFLKKQEAL